MQRLSLPTLFIILTLCLLVPAVRGQESANGSTAPMARNKKDKQPRGILNATFAWAAKPEHGIIMGAVQEVDLTNRTIKVLNQEIAISSDTLFLGKLQGLEDIKTGRAVIITTLVGDNKITALEIFRMPRPAPKQ